MKVLFKKSIVLLLLLSLVNIVTARPGSYYVTQEPEQSSVNAPRFNLTESQTLIEIVLENLRGLPDNIPNGEEQGYKHHDFCRIAKPAVAKQQPVNGQPYIPELRAIEWATLPVYNQYLVNRLYCAELGFLFRLTPF